MVVGFPVAEFGSVAGYNRRNLGAGWLATQVFYQIKIIPICIATAATIPCMEVADLYRFLKPLHIVLVLASGALFGARGFAVLSGRRWGMAPRVRYLSYGVDTLLLLAGVSLWWLLGLNPLRDAWLGSKLGLLLLYIVLGSLALKRARGHTLRRLCFVAALACFGFMLTVARLHHPGGIFAVL